MFLKDDLEFLCGDEVNILCLLASRTQKYTVSSWCKPETSEYIICFICNQKFDYNLRSQVEHGRKHIKESNLLAFL